MDMYDDSERRYLNDPAFHAAVAALENYVITEDVTPGELRQIAFYAALRVERLKPPAPYSLGFGTFYVCPNRNDGGLHSASNEPIVCQCGVPTVALLPAADHTKFPYTKV